MKTAPLLVVLLPLVLFGGCGKKEVVTEVVEPVAEAKPIEPVADAKAKPDGVNIKESKVSEGIRYLKDSVTPYTGKVFTLHENGQKEWEGNYKDGEKISETKWWNSKGEPVDSFDEADKK